MRVLEGKEEAAARRKFELGNGPDAGRPGNPPLYARRRLRL